MKAFSISKTITVLAFALMPCASAIAAPATTSPGAAPTAKMQAATVLFLDRATVLRQSSVGKDMAAQVIAAAQPQPAGQAR